ncbi:ATP-binding protein [uncultured Desulfobacter sp.]|uniref:hybrid sensor histidine kinase/response regulator n=1 Tax=uncultured Desulfobacter sp. TaxID=240139 RepID=UPI0029C8A8C6|nr:ATP-binding protein [uncultured Desulfobacter sp.]
MQRRIGYVIIAVICFFYWILDSIWSYMSFEYNLKNLIFREPGSYVDTFLLKVPPYQIVSRLMVLFLFVIIGFIIIEFIKKRQEDQNKHQEAHDTLLTVLNSLDAAIYVTDIKTYEILFMNKYLVDKCGGNFLGDACYKIFRNANDVCEHCPALDLVDNDGNLKDVVFRELQDPVTKSWYLTYDKAIKWIDGRVAHLQIATDVTRLKKLQEKEKKADEYLRQVQKMESIGNLAGGIAHDFNNLLFPIIGMSELLLEDLPENSLEFKNVQVILDAGKRGRDLVQQILSFSRQTEKKNIPVRLQQILKEALKLSRSTIPSSIQINQDIQENCGWVMADPIQLHQIVINLITNAYHAVDQSEGKINVQLKEISVTKDNPSAKLNSDSKYVMLRISDNGCGIKAAIKNKIFDPYFTTKDKDKGTGLGLAVVYGIVQDYGGDILVDSNVGEGTVFSIYLPLPEQLPETEAVDKTNSFQTGSEHILLVDDEKQVAHIEKQMLNRLGYRVTMHTSSLDALECFRENPEAFDLLLTDGTMPGLTGDRLAQEVLAIRPDIPILLCTGFSEKIDRQKAKHLGIKGFLMKPVVKSDMARMVRQILDNK